MEHSLYFYSMIIRIICALLFGNWHIVLWVTENEYVTYISKKKYGHSSTKQIQSTMIIKFGLLFFQVEVDSLHYSEVHFPAGGASSDSSAPCGLVDNDIYTNTRSTNHKDAFLTVYSTVNLNH